MPRIPFKGFRSANPNNFRYFKPGDHVTWDDRSIIEPRAARYYRGNLLVAGDTVYCRIEPRVSVSAMRRNCSISRGSNECSRLSEAWAIL